MSLRKIIFSTAAVSSVGVLRLLAQFLSVPILSRLLSPADYGVVAMAMPFMLFSMMIADAGIGMSLVRTPTDETKTWSTCFWMSVALGLGLALIMLLAAPLAAHIFSEPRLSPIVMALAGVVFMQSLATVPGADLQRAQKFKSVAAIEIGSMVAGIAAAVIIALKGGGAWALVSQQLVFFFLRMVLTWRLSRFWPQMVFDLHGVHEHLRFGRDVLSVDIIGFFTRSLDNLIVGKAINSTAVGVYSMAFQFARIPMMLVTGPLQYVLYSHLARVKDNRVLIRQTYIIVTRLLAVMVFPVMGMVAVDHYAVFRILLSRKWMASGEFFMIVAAATALQSVNALGATVVMVTGRTDVQLRIATEFGIIWIIALLSAVHFGLNAAAIAYDAAVILYAMRSLTLVLPLMECPFSSYLQAIIVPVVITVLCIALFLGLHHILPPLIWLQFGFGMLLAMLGVVLSALIQYRKIKEEIASWQLVEHMQ